MNVSYWLGIGTIVHAMTHASNQEAYIVFFSGFMIASIAWCFIMSAITVLIASHASMLVLRWLFIVCAAVVALFGGHSILNAIFIVTEKFQ